jgi:hypothetical protein
MQLGNNQLTFQGQNVPLSQQIPVVTDNPATATVSVNNNQVTVTPNPGFTGTVNLKVGVAQQGATSRGSGTSTGIFDTQAMTLTVTNADAPLTAQGKSFTVRVGEVLNSIAIATFTDPDPTAKTSDYTVSIDWGDGTTTPGNVTPSATSEFNVIGTHTYATTGTFSAKVTITDTNNPSGVQNSVATATSTFTVTNTDAPISATGGSTTVQVGQALNGATLATFTDADPTVRATDFASTIDWGDGTTTQGTVTQRSDGGFNVAGTHTYSTIGTFNATVTITHINVPSGVTGSMATATNTITVTDLQITAQGGAISVHAGQAINNQNIATFTFPNASAQPSDFGASIDWGDGTTTAGTVVTNPSGGFAVAGSHTYTTAGTFNAVVTITHTNVPAGATGSTATATNVITVSPPLPVLTPTQNFITNLYQDLLNRAPDGSGMTAISAALDGGKITRGLVVQFIVTSVEYRTVRIEQLYQKLLGRPADGPALNFYLRFVMNGGRFEDVEAVIVASAEYEAASTTGNNTDAAFLNKAYHDILNRAPDDVSLLNAEQKLAINGTRTQVADDLIKSYEGHAVLLEQDYQKLLGRTLDPATALSMAKQMPATTYDELFTIFVAQSPEYFGKPAPQS